MEKEAIATRFKQASSWKEFLELINALRSETYSGADDYGFTQKQLFASCNQKNPRRYTFSIIPKKSGGVRQIAAPQPTLKWLLRYTKQALDACYNPKPCVQGFTPGRSVLGNANMHLHQNYVYNIDLSDFFPSIVQQRIYARLKAKPYCLSEKVSALIAQMCCVEYKSEDGTTYRALPQGAPTSPVLSNMVCERLDRRLTGLAKRFGLHYSRYADDMTFSSMHNVYQPGSEFLTELRRLIVQEGFRFNDKKTRLQKRGARQEVTGLIVGEKANVSRQYLKQIRSILHIWEKFGYKQAYAKFSERYKADKGYGRKVDPVLEYVLAGKIAYLGMVKGQDDSTYKKLHKRYEALICGLETANKSGWKRHAKVTYTIAEFKKFFPTAKLHFSVKPNRDYVSGQVTSEDVTTPVYFVAQFRKLPDKEQQRILSEISEGTSSWHISLIEDKDQKRNKFNHFWQLSPYKPKVATRPDIDVKRLLRWWSHNGFDAAVALWKSTLNVEPNSPEQDFIRYLKSHLADYDEAERFRILASSIPITNPYFGCVVFRLHNPHKMIEFLSLLFKDDSLRWFFHKWDKPCNSVYHKYQYHNLCDKYKLLNQYCYGPEAGISELLLNHVKNFINLNPDHDYALWDQYNHELKVKWLSVVEWCAMFEHDGLWPGNIIMQDGYPFAHSIERFKRTVMFDADADIEDSFGFQIKKIFKNIDSDIAVRYTETFNALCLNLAIYCDVRALFNGLRTLCRVISDRKARGSEVAIDLQRFPDRYELSVFHKCSYFTQEEEHDGCMTGDLAYIRKALFSVCDFGILADLQGNHGALCMRILDAYSVLIGNKKFAEKVIAEPYPETIGGVKYILKLYRT